MKNLLLACLCLLCNHLIAQNGIIGTGFTPGWNNPADLVTFDEGFGNSRIKVLNANNTGLQYFRFVKAWNFNNQEFGPSSCSDEDLTGTLNTEINGLSNACGGAFYLNIPNTTDNYVFKTADPDGNDVILFKVEGVISTVDAVDHPGIVYENFLVNITATLSDAAPAGQSVYLRYSTDGFASSTIVPMSPTVGFASAPTDYTASIPGQPAGTTVDYYVLTSGTAPDHTTADFYTINGNTNGGSNYSYTVQMLLPVEITSFTGTALEKGNLLEWNVESEINFSHYSIEKEIRGRWEEIGTVKGIGSRKYEYVDRSPKPSEYYRLRMVDLDGVYEYSDIITIESNRRDITLSQSAEEITIHGLTEFDVVTIYDLNGRLLKSHITNTSEHTISLTELHSGMYILTVASPSGLSKYQQKFIK